MDKTKRKAIIAGNWKMNKTPSELSLIHIQMCIRDRYYYEAAEMALIDTNCRLTFATGIAGCSHVVDSLSAINYAKVKVCLLYTSRCV